MVSACWLCFSTWAAKASTYCFSTFCSDSLISSPFSLNASPTPFQIDFRLLQNRATNARQDILQVFGGADAAERTR
jgi:hypothetical protein